MAKQLELTFHGGKRKNAGRKNRSGHLAHTRRPRVDARKPLHVTLKTTPGLRKPGTLKGMKHACRRVRHFNLYVIQFAMLGNHMHLIVEAKSNEALTRGLQSLTGIFAKRFKTRFRQRYHLNVITTPKQMRNTYRYVLLNYARHAGLPNHVDPYSSANTFEHLKKLAKIYGPNEYESPEKYGLTKPTSWLANRGWRHAR